MSQKFVSCKNLGGTLKTQKQRNKKQNNIDAKK